MVKSASRHKEEIFAESWTGRTSNTQVAIYSPSHPSVLFHNLKTGVTRRWNQSRIGKGLYRWLHPPRKKQAETAPAIRNRGSGLILPQKGKSFMLIQTSDTMSDLLAENYRLRNLVDELLREDRREELIITPRL